MKYLPCLFVIVCLASCAPDDTFISDGNPDDITNNPANNDEIVSQFLNLPDNYFNYSAPNYPDHFFGNGGGGGGNNSVLATDSEPNNNPVTDAGATLGRVLFYDTKLSANETVACASCHKTTEGLSDGVALSEGFDGELTGRHSMGLTNARFNNNGRYFWDERAATLEEQVLMPFQDPVEMGITLQELEDKVADQAFYPSLFNEAFGDEEITTQRISRALAQFVRSMVSYESKYDIGRAQVNNPRTDFANFTNAENLGKRLFFDNPNQGGAGCAACHGTEVFIQPGPRNNGLDATTTDAGIGGANGNNNQIGSFRSPSLRNIALDAPFMHDGRFATLAEVVEHYNSGVQAHPNLSNQLRGQNGAPRVLNLTQEEKDALVAFMHTLTDEGMLNNEKFSNPFISSELN